VRTYGLSEAQQDQVWAALRTGESVRSIARHQQSPLHHVQRYLSQNGGVPITAASGGWASDGRGAGRGVPRDCRGRVLPAHGGPPGPVARHD
jgi:hypothetical protein